MKKKKKNGFFEVGLLWMNMFFSLSVVYTDYLEVDGEWALVMGWVKLDFELGWLLKIRVCAQPEFDLFINGVGNVDQNPKMLSWIQAF